MVTVCFVFGRIFSGAERIFNNLAQDYIKFRMDAAEVFVRTIIPAGPGASQAMDDLFDKATQMQIDLYRSYGIISGQGNGHIGAIDLIIPLAAFTGDLYTERTFQVLQSPYDSIVITIKKTGGKRGMKIRACSKYSNGSIHDNSNSREIPDGEENNGTERTIIFPKDMADKNISIHLVADGGGLGAANKCDYTLKIKGFFKASEMQKVYDENHRGKNEKTAPQQLNAAGEKQQLKPGVTTKSDNMLSEDSILYIKKNQNELKTVPLNGQKQNTNTPKVNNGDSINAIKPVQPVSKRKRN